MERRKSTAAMTQSSTGKAGTTSRTQMSEAVMSQMGDTMTVISAAPTEVPMSKTKSVVGDDGEMAVPDLPRQRKCRYCVGCTDKGDNDSELLLAILHKNLRWF